MRTLAEIYARKKEASGQVSTQTRNLALGFLAISWALLTAHDEPLRSMAANLNRYAILLLAASSVLVLACDLLQYVFITLMAEQTATRAVNAHLSEAQYDKRSCAYRVQAVMYQAKFWIVVAGSLWALGIFLFLFMPIKVQPPVVQQPTSSCVSISSRDSTLAK